MELRVSDLMHRFKSIINNSRSVIDVAMTLIIQGALMTVFHDYQYV
jgi:hypothetical protein